MLSHLSRSVPVILIIFIVPYWISTAQGIPAVARQYSHLLRSGTLFVYKPSQLVRRQPHHQFFNPVNMPPADPPIEQCIAQVLNMLRSLHDAVTSGQQLNIVNALFKGFPNPGVLIHTANNLYSAKRYLNVKLIDYQCPVGAASSECARDNDAYGGEPIRVCSIAPPLNFSDPWLEKDVGLHTRIALDALERQDKRYYLHDSFPHKLLSVEGDVE
jgi:hypothetical protein